MRFSLRAAFIGASLLAVSTFFTAIGPVEPPPMVYRDWLDQTLDRSARTQTLTVRPINGGSDEFLTAVAVNLNGSYPKRSKDMQLLQPWVHREGNALDAVDEVAAWIANNKANRPNNTLTPQGQARINQAVDSVLSARPELAAAPLDPNAVAQAIGANVAPIANIEFMLRTPRSSRQPWYANWSNQTHLALARIMIDLRLQAAGRQLPSGVDQLPPPATRTSFDELADRGVFVQSRQWEESFDRVRALVDQLPQAFAAAGESR